jgi:hypothetical protein
VQRPVPLLSASAAGDDLIDQSRRKRPGQHSYRDQVGESPVRRRLPPTMEGHVIKLHKCGLTERY